MVFQGPRWWRPLIKLIEPAMEGIPTARRHGWEVLVLPDQRQVRLPVEGLRQGAGPLAGDLVGIRGALHLRGAGFFELRQRASSSHSVIILETVTKRQTSCYARDVPLEESLGEVLRAEGGLFGLHSFELDSWSYDGDEAHDHLFWYHPGRIERLPGGAEPDAELERWCRKAREHHEHGWYLPGRAAALALWVGRGEHRHPPAR
jgi:hypothetical protein